MAETSCPSCGARFAPVAGAPTRFCPSCGASLAASPAPRRDRADRGGGLLAGLEGFLASGGAQLLEQVAAQLIQSGAFNGITHPRGHQLPIGACVKDPHDPNDLPFDSHLNVDPSALPRHVDLRDHLTPVEDQGHLGSCTANAIAGAYEYLEKRIAGREGRVSRLFIYFNERALEGTTDQDSGASLRTGMKVLQKYGACAEDTWPYDPSAFKQQPGDPVYSEAAEHTVDEYRSVPIDLHAMKVCLAEGYPFVFGARIFQSFEEHGHHGRIELPRPGEKDLGGHAMLACGYSDEDGVIVVRNSWGPDWGDGGYAYFPYDYLANPDLVHDGWTVRRAHNLDFTEGTYSGDEHRGRSFFAAAAGGASYAGDGQDQASSLPTDEPALDDSGAQLAEDAPGVADPGAPDPDPADEGDDDEDQEAEDDPDEGEDAPA